MKKIWTAKPQNAWLKYVLPRANDVNWIESSKYVSGDIELSNRELFGLIILAYSANHFKEGWRVGFDPGQGEPNDGFIINGQRKIFVEHKVIARFDDREVLNAIIETYHRFAEKGINYGKNRLLLIHPNKGASHGGLVKISDLRDSIGTDSPFDQVILLGMVSRKETKGVFHLSRHYPPRDLAIKSVSNIIHVDFEFTNGTASVPYAGFQI